MQGGSPPSGPADAEPGVRPSAAGCCCGLDRPHRGRAWTHEQADASAVPVAVEEHAARSLRGGDDASIHEAVAGSGQVGRCHSPAQALGWRTPRRRTLPPGHGEASARTERVGGSRLLGDAQGPADEGARPGCLLLPLERPPLLGYRLWRTLSHLHRWHQRGKQQGQHGHREDRPEGEMQRLP